MKKQKILLISLLLLSIITMIGTAYAFVVRELSDTTINVVTTKTLKATIVEKYDPPEVVFPTMTIEKEVHIENTGETDIIIRVEVTKAWGPNRDANGNLVVDNTLLTDNILIDYDTTYWMEINGYFYYTEILKPGETTKVPLFKEFTIDPQTGNEYQGMEADIIVTVEAIQASNNAIEDIWNMQYGDINIIEPTEEVVDQGPTRVTFISPNERFDIHKTKLDLFGNFKELEPGSARSQIVIVGNKYRKTQDIYMRANYTVQDETTRALVESMLENHIFVTIFYEGNVIYDGPVNGNVLDNTNQNSPISMYNYIPLGKFNPNEYKDLVITLTVDKYMGDEYQGLLGEIEWEFLTYFEAADLVVCHYKEGTNIELAPCEYYEYGSYDYYETRPADIPGYEIVEIPANAKGYLNNDKVYVKYYYRPLEGSPGTGDNITGYMVLLIVSGLVMGASMIGLSRMNKTKKENN